MPIYEYDCKQCGVFEITQRITESPLTTCPKCNGDVHRLISMTSFVLKGSGWYATDYARSEGKGEPSSDSAAKEQTANGASDKASASPSESAKTPAAEPAKSSQDKSTSTNSTA